MALTNTQENEIIYCKAQIQRREQELAILEAEFKDKEWRSEGGVLDEKGLWDFTQKMGKHRDEIQRNRKRRDEIRSEAQSYGGGPAKH